MPMAVRRTTVAGPEPGGGEPGADVVILQEGEEPKNPRNGVLVEQIPGPRCTLRYTLAW